MSSTHFESCGCDREYRAGAGYAGHSYRSSREHGKAGAALNQFPSATNRTASHEAASLSKSVVQWRYRMARTGINFSSPVTRGARGTDCL